MAWMVSQVVWASGETQESQGLQESLEKTEPQGDRRREKREIMVYPDCLAAGDPEGPVEPLESQDAKDNQEILPLVTKDSTDVLGDPEATASEEL